jgi:hypothetical protein
MKNKEYVQNHMVKCLHSMFCKECIYEADGLISLSSIFDHVYFPILPAKMPLCFVCFLELSLEKYNMSDVKDLDVRILIKTPSGVNASETRPEIPFRQVSNEKAQAAVAVSFGEITLYEFGKYDFEVFSNDMLLYTNFFEVIQREV